MTPRNRRRFDVFAARCWLTAALALTLLACETPDWALRTRCQQTTLFSSGGECELTLDRLVKRQISSLPANTKNFQVRVEASFRVKKGAAKISVGGCEAGGTGTVTDDQPLTLKCDAKTNRNDFTFSVVVDPTSVPSQGLVGTVVYQAI